MLRYEGYGIKVPWYQKMFSGQHTQSGHNFYKQLQRLDGYDNVSWVKAKDSNGCTAVQV